MFSNACTSKLTLAKVGKADGSHPNLNISSTSHKWTLASDTLRGFD